MKTNITIVRVKGDRFFQIEELGVKEYGSITEERDNEITVDLGFVQGWQQGLLSGIEQSETGIFLVIYNDDVAVQVFNLRDCHSSMGGSGRESKVFATVNQNLTEKEQKIADWLTRTYDREFLFEKIKGLSSENE